MAIVVSYNAQIMVGGTTFPTGTDLSDHCVQVTVNDGQESKDVTAMGATARTYRAGLGTASIEATFLGDVASGSVASTLLPLITMTSTGFLVTVRKDKSSARGASNPEYQMISIIDGQVNMLDEKPGEVSQCKVKFVPYSSFTVVTSGS